MTPHFRFEDLEIWQVAANMAVRFHKLAEKLDDCDLLSRKITNFSRTL
jgi:hypothetical protein